MERIPTRDWGMGVRDLECVVGGLAEAPTSSPVYVHSLLLFLVGLATDKRTGIGTVELVA